MREDSRMYYKPFLNPNRGYVHIERLKSRFLFICTVFIVSFCAICCRLLVISVVERDEYYCKHGYYSPADEARAEIVDCNGRLLATNIPTVSAYAVPKDMLDINDALSKLCNTFKDIDKENLLKRIKRSRKFVWVKRHLSPLQEQELLGLGIPGIYLIKTERRVYPCKDLCPHVVGFTDVDNNGIAGIEKSMDSYLKNNPNKPLQLSLDARVQNAVKTELARSIDKFHAKGAGGVVINIKTGEIVSLVSLPDFDPNIVTNPLSKENFNIITNAALEPGSSAKIINTALALQYGNGIKSSTKFDARFPIKVGRRVINDYHGKYTFLSVEEILKYSSNIGSVKMVLQVGVDKQKEFFKRLGLLEPLRFDLCGMQKPIYPKKWSEISGMTISFGHGIAFNPLQYIAAISGLLNDGIYVHPTLLSRKRDIAIQTKRLISPEISKQLCYLLRIDVLEGGNRKAEAKGYLVGGKTGTTEKTRNGRYIKDANYTCFLGAFPMTDPEYLVYVVLDEPQGTKETFGFATAGWNAAPTVSNIIRKIANLLHVAKYDGEEVNWKLMLT